MFVTFFFSLFTLHPVRLTVFFSFPVLQLFLQIAISAGHEFVVSTEAKYSEICDDKIMYLDYVSMPSFGVPITLGEIDGMLTFLLFFCSGI